MGVRWTYLSRTDSTDLPANSQQGNASSDHLPVAPMTRIGILVNPSAARDIRRLVARASSLSITDRCAMVRRMLVGMGTMGVEQVLMMFDQAGIAGGISNELEGTIKSDELRLPEVQFLKMPVDGVPGDTLLAVRQMRESGVQAIVVLGGDGTHRLVAHECGSIPLVCVSTGTNNAFPQHYEATVVGLAAGAIAMGGVSVERACRRSKRLACAIDGAPQIPALVDICITTEQWVGARALWRPEHLQQLFLTFAEPGAIGLSAIGSLIQPVPRWEDAGLWIEFDVILTPFCCPVLSMLAHGAGNVMELSDKHCETGVCFRHILLVFHLIIWHSSINNTIKAEPHIVQSDVFVKLQ